MGRLATAMILGPLSGRHGHSRSGVRFRERAALNRLRFSIGCTIFVACLLMLAGCGHSPLRGTNGCGFRYLIFMVNGRKLESSTCFGAFTPVFSVTVHPGAVITVEQKPHPEAGGAVSSDNPEVLPGTFRARDYVEERFRAMKAGGANLQVIGCPTFATVPPGSTVAPSRVLGECVTAPASLRSVPE